MLHFGPPCGIRNGVMATDYLSAIGGEARATPRAGDSVPLPGAAGRLRWECLDWARAVAGDEEPQPQPLLSAGDEAVSSIHYFAMVVGCDKAQDVELDISHANELSVWVGGRPVAQWPEWDGGQPRRLPVPLPAGSTQLLFKLCERPGGTWFAVKFGGDGLRWALEIPPSVVENPGDRPLHRLDGGPADPPGWPPPASAPRPSHRLGHRRRFTLFALACARRCCQCLRPRTPRQALPA